MVQGAPLRRWGSMIISLSEVVQLGLLVRSIHQGWFSRPADEETIVADRLSETGKNVLLIERGPLSTYATGGSTVPQVVLHYQRVLISAQGSDPPGSLDKASPASTFQVYPTKSGSTPPASGATTRTRTK